MAIAFNHLTTGGDTSNVATYTTASIAPAANRILYAAVFATAPSAGIPNTPTLTGTMGLTWELVRQAPNPSAIRTLFWFRAATGSAPPPAGTLTFNFGGSSLTGAQWCVYEVAGADMSGANGSGATVQSIESRLSSQTTLNAPFDLPVDPANGVLCVMGLVATATVTATGGWSSPGGTTTYASPNQSLAGIHSNTALQNATASWGVAGNTFVIAIEVKAASAVVTGAGALAASPPSAAGAGSVVATGAGALTAASAALTGTGSVDSGSAGTAAVVGTVTVAGTAALAEAASAQSVTCDVPAGVAAGELLVVAFTGTNGTVPDQAGWTTIAVGTSAPPSGMFYRVATAAEPASYTFTGLNSGGANRLTAEMVRLAGVDTATPLDVPGQRNSGSGGASLTVTGLTTVTAGALVLYTAGVNAATATDITPDPNTTLLVNSTGTGRRTILASEARPTAGATGSRTFTETGTTGVAIAVIVAAFRPSAGGGGADTTAPSVPTDVTATAGSATSVTVSWSASTDDTGVASYRVRRGGVDLTGATAVTGTSYTDTTVAASTSYSYTVSAVDAAGNRSTESTAATVATPAVVGSFTFAITGAPTGASVPIKVKTSGAASVRLKLIKTSDSSATFTAAVVPDASGYASFVVSGLSSGTAYTYQAEVEGTLASQVGSFTTDLPGQARNFRAAFGSCLMTGDTHTTAFDNAAANAPELFLHLGDWLYGDDRTTSQAAHQSAIEGQIAANSGLASLIRTVPLAYQWSDHDSGNNDWTGGPATWTPSYNAAYREVIPVEGTLPSGGIYHSVHRGRVKFILTDGRSFKSPASATDDASKTMFGAAQEAWIASELADPAYPVKVICLDVPWVYPTTAGDDKWGGYKAAAQRLIDAINANAPGRVFLIHGDAHTLCADDGSSANNRGSLPVAGAAPFYNSTSIKGGPYSQGTWPISGSTGGWASQHGLLDVTDTGSAITIRYSGRDGANTERVTLTKTYTVAAVTGAGGLTASPATLNGAGSLRVTGSGGLTATPPTMFGAATPTVAGAGQLDAAAATLAGAALLRLAGQGTLTAPPAGLVGGGGVGAVGIDLPPLTQPVAGSFVTDGATVGIFEDASFGGVFLTDGASTAAFTSDGTGAASFA